MATFIFLSITALTSLTVGVAESAQTVVPSVDCQNKPQSDMPFCNTSLSFMERAQDLVSRLTTEEKADQTSTIAPAIPRLGIKDYNWRSNCLHGWTASGGHWPSDLKWTVFPAPMGLAATFNPDLVLKVGQATADEGRALHNEMLAINNGSSPEAAALNCFSPNVNLLRDPRWGRAEETFGEDPYVVSVIGAAYTRGLQEGDSKNYLKIAACAKHYAVHSGPDNIRKNFSANVTLHDLYDTYLAAFKSQVLGARVAQMMTAHSGTRCKYQQDGAPDTANPFLLKTVLREQFGASNISIVCDNGGVGDVYSTHDYVGSYEMAAAIAMNATTDLDLGHEQVYPEYLPKALADGLVDMQTITDAVTRNFYLRMMLGDFDPLSMVPYQLIDKSHLDTPQNQALNLQAARESIVLLKNSREYTLPINLGGIKELAVIGPNANVTSTLLSNYNGIPSKVVTVLQGIEEAAKDYGVKVNYAPGCKNVACESKENFQAALQIAKSADYVIVVIGLDHTVEGESHDRKQMSCGGGESHDVLEPPGCQNDLVEEIAALNGQVILVLINGGPVSLSQLYTNSRITGIMEAFYPGALGGTAVADVLFGNYNPGGRMPVTTYVSSGELPPAVDYDMTTPPGRTYRYYEKAPLIPFGYGLSYSLFGYINLTVSKNILNTCESVKISVAVKNYGEMAGDEVILLYLEPPRFSDKPFLPRVQLVGFQRATIDVGNTYVASFEINPYLMSLVDEDGVHYVFPGLYTVTSSHQLSDMDDIKLKGNFTVTGNSPVKTSSCTLSPQCLACKPQL